MLSEIDGHRLRSMVNVSSLSPLLYLFFAFLIDNYSDDASGGIDVLNKVLLALSFIAVVASRLLEQRMAPYDPVAMADMPAGRAALTVLLISGMAESISFMGVIIVALGAPVSAYFPFFIMSVLAFADFRIFRFQRLHDIVAQNDEDAPHD